MTENEIIEMAKEVGLIDADYEIGQWDIHEVTTFAKLVAAKEREACAKMLEDWNKHAWNPFDCAAAIRARGEQA